MTDDVVAAPGPRKTRWHFTQVIASEVAVDSPASLDAAEQMLREYAVEKNTKQGLRIVSDTGPEWFESPNEVAADYFDENRRFITERAWTRGEPIEFEFLFLRMSGWSIPLLPEEA